MKTNTKLRIDSNAC